MSVNLFAYCVIVILTCLHAGFAVRIEITPDTFNNITDLTVQISCAPDNKDATAKEILVMELSKDGGKPIVFIRHGTGISNNGMDTNHLHASGHIDDVVKQSYLNLTIGSPESKDGGLYTCVMYFLDEFGVLKEERENKRLTEENYMLTPLEKILLSEISSLREKVAYTMTAFSATNNFTTITLNAGMVVAFPDVIMKQGEGYNPQTGVFKAPLPGFYTFHLIGYAGCIDCRIHLSIQANDEVLARLLIGDEDFMDQSSISTFVKLSEGDEVKVVVGTVSGRASFYYGQNSVFTGYLIKPY